MMKKILSILLILTCKTICAHDIQFDKTVLREWHVGKNVFKGSFLYHKHDSVFFEDEKQAMIGFPIKAFGKKDIEYFEERIKEIKNLNKEINSEPNKTIITDREISNRSLIIAGILIILLFYRIRKSHPTKLKYVIPVFFTGISTILFGFTNPSIIQNAFLPFAPDVHTFWDNNYFYVESKGIPSTHTMMVGISNHGWQQQVPIPQCYIGNNSWSIPLNPVMATNPIPVDQNHFTRGAIAIAVNGVPIFNPYTNTGVDAYLDGQLDNYGGHSGRGDDYHYHIAPLHLYNQTSSTLPIAYGFDGYAVYGNLEPDGTPMVTLDNNHGHNYNGDYHYHGTSSAPYMIAKFAGVVTEDQTNQLIPQAHATPVRTENWTPLNGALITACTPNISNNGYNLTYTVNGVSGYATNYSWNGTNYSFVYSSPTGSSNVNYNGFNQCNVPLLIESNNEIHSTDIYPNPFSEQIQDKNFNNLSFYILFNGLGEIIYSGTTIENHDFSSLPQGLYYLQTKHHSKAIRLIKK